MNVVGIDVSKGKSTVAILTPGVGMIDPFRITHDRDGFDYLKDTISSLSGETRVVMESTGRYHTLLADNLYRSGYFVSVLNAKLLSGFDNNSLRKVKTDCQDSIKICNYGATYWSTLEKYVPEESIRKDLRNLCRQRTDLLKMSTTLNNQLISVSDIVFPGVNKVLNSVKTDGSMKWVDFIESFHSAAKVAKMKLPSFRNSYKKFCIKHGYCYQETKADELHSKATVFASAIEESEAACLITNIYARQLQEINRSVAQISVKMHELSERLPEYEIVMQMYGVGKELGPQLMAEIGDVRRFHSKNALVAYAGIDPPPFQSGQFVSKSRKISKRGSSQLRKTLFLIMKIYVVTGAEDQDIFKFIQAKRSEGKHYYSALVAGANKFLRQYYAKVVEALGPIEEKD